MSNTQFAFIQKEKVPNRKALQESIDKLGFKLKLDPEFTPFDDEGFSPCELEGDNEAGFEIYYEKSEDVIEDDEEFKEIAGNKDFCICMCWGGRMKDCASVMIVSAALAKDFDAVISYEGYEPEPIEKLIEETSLVIKDAMNEDKEELERVQAVEKAKKDGDFSNQIKNIFKRLQEMPVTNIGTGDILILRFSDNSILKSWAYSFTTPDGVKHKSYSYPQLKSKMLEIYDSCGFNPSNEQQLELDSLSSQESIALEDDAKTSQKLEKLISNWPEEIQIKDIAWTSQDKITISFIDIEDFYIEMYAFASHTYVITLETDNLSYKITDNECELF